MHGAPGLPSEPEEALCASIWPRTCEEKETNTHGGLCSCWYAGVLQIFSSSALCASIRPQTCEENEWTTHVGVRGRVEGALCT